MADDIGETPETAGAIKVGESILETLERSGDDDWFAVDLVAGRQYQIDMEGSSSQKGTLFNPMIYGVYDAASDRLPNITYDDDGGYLRDSQLTFEAQDTGTFYIWARTSNNVSTSQRTGTYLLTISNTANLPPLGDVDLIGNAVIGGTLVAETTGLSDLDGMGALSYQWLRNGAAIEGATTDSFTLTDADFGSEVAVAVSYTDGQDNYERIVSAETATVLSTGQMGRLKPTTAGFDIDRTYYTADQNVTALAGGGYVAVYERYQSVWMRLYDSADNPVGQAVEIDFDGQPDVAALKDGGFVVVGTKAFSGEAYAEIVAQRYDNTGAAIGDRFVVNSVSQGNQDRASIVTLKDGGYVVVWQSSPYNNIAENGQDGSKDGIFGQRFDSAGNAAGGEFQVNTYTENAQLAPRLTALNDGGFMVVWMSYAQTGSVNGVYAQRYDASGAAAGAEMKVGTTGTYGQVYPDIAVLKDGSTVVVWYSGAGVKAAMGQIFDPSGAAVGEEFQISTGTLYNTNGGPSVVANSDGGFTVVYGDVYAQRFDRFGGRVGDEFQANVDRDGQEIAFSTLYEPTVDVIDDGKLIVSWSNDNFLKAQIFSDNAYATGAVAITGDAAENQVLTADTSGLRDADGLGAFTYQWLRDGAEIYQETAATYTPDQEDVGTRLSVVVSYVDGAGVAETVTSGETAKVQNVNSAPTGGAALRSTIVKSRDGGVLYTDEGAVITVELNSYNNELADEDGLGEFSYQWLRDGVAIDGATNDRLWAQQVDVGTKISVAVSYVDGQGTLETVESNVFVVENVNDTPRGTVLISGTAAEKGELTADASSLSDEDGLGTFHYQWINNGVGGTGTPFDIVGATSETYSPTQDEVGSQLSVRVTYTDAYGTEESVTSGKTAEVTNANNLPTGGIAIVGRAIQGQVLTMIPTDLADEDGLNSFTSYQWFRDGIAVTGETGATYTVTTNDFDAFLTVQASYVDGFGTTETLTSDRVGFEAFVEMTTTPNSVGMTHLGGGLNEKFSGYDQGDMLAGGNGADTILGGDGNDTILGYDATVQIDGAPDQYTHGSAILDDYSPISVSMTSVSETSAGTVTISGFVAPEVFTTEGADIVVVLDVSGSTSSGFSGSISVPDANRDGTSGTILDAEIVAFDSLMKSITNDARMGDSDVKLIRFSSGANVHATGTAGADQNNDGLADIVRTSQSLRSTGGTEFLPPLDLAIAHFQQSQSDQRILYFLSDGEADTAGVPYRVQQLQALGVDIRTYAVGNSASDENMDIIDDGIRNGSATIVTDPSQLSARLIESTIDQSAIAGVQVLLNGQVVGNYDSSVLKPSPFGLRFDLDVDGLTSGDDKVEVRVTAADGKQTTVSVANTIYDAGPTDPDVLYGENGHDSIDGGPGQDVLYGGEGADSLIGNYGDDTLDGGVGVDTAIYDLKSDEVTVLRYGDEATVTSAFGTDVLRGVELLQFTDKLVRFSSYSDRALIRDFDLTGTSANDILRGEEGNDTLRGLDGSDTLVGNGGNDVLIGGASEDDIRDVIYGGDGNDSIDGSYGNDELRGDAGNDTITGGFGVDNIIGGDGDDVLTGQAWSDLIFGGTGDDFINGGFGFDRVNGGTGADRFFHLGIFDHGSDWIQDYNAAEGDVLMFGQGGATKDQFQVNFTETPSAGAAGVAEAFVIYRPTGQILWALIDGEAQREINLLVGGTTHDLLF